MLGVEKLKSNHDAQVEARVIGAQLALLSGERKIDQARALIEEAGKHVTQLRDTSRTAGEFHYWKYQLARATKDYATTVQEAEWIVKNRPRQEYVQAALITLALDVERKLKSAQDEEKGKLQKQAYDLYRELSDAMGTTEEILKSKKNAAIAATRLAKYASLVGKHSEATKILETLVKIHSRDARYIRMLALAQFQAKNFDRALELWRRLVNGLKKESNGWYEAKLYGIASLAELEKSEALKEFNQYKLLRPNLGPPAWREQFKELGKKLSR